MPTISEARARVETDLDDATLTTIINAETEFMTRQVGADTETETQFASGLRTIVLNRKPNTITSITERQTRSADPVTLAVNDWRQVGKYGLRRLADGTNPAGSWGSEVVVAYAPDIDLQLRERVLLDLIQLSVEFRAFDIEEVGDWRGEQKDFDRRRNAIVSQVREGRGLIA